MKTLVLKSLMDMDRRLYLRGLKFGTPLTLPNFVGIGPGQTGSTWLARHLALHPEVFLFPFKESNYFSYHLHEISVRSYAKKFSCDQDRLRGEISPSYSILTRERIALMAKLLPGVRLILTLRNPIMRSWSAARRVMPKLGTTISDISDRDLFNYLDQEWAYRPANGAVVPGDFETGHLEGHYTRTLDNWLSIFKPEQLLVIFFDDIINRPAALLERVCEHLDIDPTHRWNDRALGATVNSNPPHPMPERVREYLEVKYRTEIESLAARLGGPAQTWLDDLNQR